MIEEFLEVEKPTNMAHGDNKNASNHMASNE
jgi:hypothetical protein